MAKPGPKPKPTRVKMLAGNPGKRALNEQEPQFDSSSMPQCPEHITGEARAEWERVVPELYQANVLAQVDRATLAAYCQSYARWVDAEGKVQAAGAIVKTKAGNLIQNPYLAVANRAMEQMVKYAAEFGMTPSSRSRLQVEPRQDLSAEEALAEKLFNAKVNQKAEK